MNKIQILLFSLFLSVALFAQKNEYGIGVGMLNYSGDLSRGYKPLSGSLGITGNYRLNLSEIVAIKYSLTYGQLKGNEDLRDAFSSVRNHQFKTKIWEGAIAFEYHFLDFKRENAQVSFSPYASIGMAMTRISGVPSSERTINRYQASLPFGIGVKKIFDRRWSASIEWTAHKMFTDYLDGVSSGDLLLETYQYGNPKDADWYYFSQITLSYIIYKVPCPFPYVPNQSIFNNLKRKF